MAEQDLNRTQIACRLVDDGRFGPAKGVGAVLFCLKTDAGHPLANQASVLPGAHVVHVVVSAWEHIVVEISATALKLGEQGFARRLDNLELDGSLGLLLDDDGAISDASAGHDVADTHLDHVAATQLTVDGEIEERPIACSVTATSVAGTSTASASATVVPVASTTDSASVDATKLPVGDTYVSTTSARVGYAYMCNPAKSGGAGATTKGPWFNSDGTTWNSLTKLIVSGTVSWASSFMAAISGSQRQRPADPYHRHLPNPVDRCGLCL